MLGGVISRLKTQDREKICFTVFQPTEHKGQYCLTDVEKVKLKMQKARDAKALKSGASRKAVK
jgi:hypothetical protein